MSDINKKYLYIYKFSTGDLKEKKMSPLATRVKTVKILLIVIRINNTRLSVYSLFFFCILQQTGSLVGVNLFNA